MKRVAVSVLKQKIEDIKEEISFNAYANEITAILSCDSRLITNLIDSLINPKGRSSVAYYDHKLDKQRDYILNFVGYMPNKLPSFKRMTIKEYFEYSSKFYKGDYSENIEKLFDLFSIDKTRRIKDISYEEKKIISFIDAVFFGPEVLILDNPFENISNIVATKMISVINTIKANGFSVILTSIKYDYLTICDRIYMLDYKGIEQIKQFKNPKLFVSFEFEGDYDSIKDIIASLTKQNPIITNQSVAFVYEGDINLLLSKINKVKIIDLKIYPCQLYQLGV